MKAFCGCFVVLFLFLAACVVKNQAEGNGYEVQADSSDAEQVCAQSKEEENSNDVKTENERAEKDGGYLEFEILGKETLSIDESRIDDLFLDNRWTLEEIDKILNSIKGCWTVDQYVGFVSDETYFPQLRPIDNIDEQWRNDLLEEYQAKVEEAKNNLPSLIFSIKERDLPFLETDANYIYIDGLSPSPISVTLSMENEVPSMLADSEMTADSPDFQAEYPVLYIRFFFSEDRDDERVYLPATLVITSDDRFYLLLDRAFYSLKPSEYPELIPAVNEEEADNNEFDLDKYMEIADFVWDNIPELKNYAEYVEEKSEGHAAFVVDPNYELKELYVENEFRGNYYYVYTGEVWEDHRVNWDWFLVSEHFDEILWWDIVEIEYLTLDEWRQSSSYRELEW